ncbi:MAG: hypothetical protein R3F08_00345 [Dokdonella sp.]
MIRRPIAALVLLAACCARVRPRRREEERRTQMGRQCRAWQDQDRALQQHPSGGTWLDLDVQPGRQALCFSLLGDTALPIGGGKAKRLTKGPAWAVQPRFRGRQGDCHLRSRRRQQPLAHAGHRRRRHPGQQEDFRLLNNLSLDAGRPMLIDASTSPASVRSAAGELWMYHISGGAGLQLTKRKNDQQDLGEPAVSADGRLSIFRGCQCRAEFQYNKDPHGLIYDRRFSIAATARPKPSSPRRAVQCAQTHHRTGARWPSSSACATPDRAASPRSLRNGEAKPLCRTASHGLAGSLGDLQAVPRLRLDPRFEGAGDLGTDEAPGIVAASGEHAQIPFATDVEQTLAEPLRFEGRPWPAVASSRR